MKETKVEAICVTEYQAALIFEALNHCRGKISPLPNAQREVDDLTKAMRLFAWRTT